MNTRNWGGFDLCRELRFHTGAPRLRWDIALDRNETSSEVYMLFFLLITLKSFILKVIAMAEIAFQALVIVQERCQLMYNFVHNFVEKTRRIEISCYSWNIHPWIFIYIFREARDGKPEGSRPPAKPQKMVRQLAIYFTRSRNPVKPWSQDYQS